jgi:hypothetical protein
VAESPKVECHRVYSRILSTPASGLQYKNNGLDMISDPENPESPNPGSLSG